MHSFDDDEEETDMNSSCAAVSQILLSLEDALPRSPYNKLTSAHRPTDCEDISGNYESQSTVDGTSLTVDDDGLVAADDHDRQVSDMRQIAGNDDDDETQYVEQCPNTGLGLVPLLRLDHVYHTEDIIALSVGNSPSVLDATKPFQFMSSDDIVQMSDTTTVTNAAPVVTVADTEMFDVDIEPQGQVRGDIGQNSISLSADNSASVLDAAKLSQLMLSNDIVQMSSTATEMNAASVFTPPHTHMLDVDIEQQGQVIPDFSQSDSCNIVSVSPTAVMNAASVVTAADTHMFDVGIEPRGQLRPDVSQNSIAMSADNSPSLLDTTKLFQLMSSNDIIVPMSSTTTDMNAGAVVTAADTQMFDVSIEAQGQARPDVSHTLSVDNSPSLLDVTSPFRFMSSDDIIVSTTSTTIDLTVASVVTSADTQMLADDIELQGQMRADISQSDTFSTVSVPAVCSVIEGSLAPQSLLISTGDHQVQLCSPDATSDVTIHSAAAISHSATHLEYVEISDDDRPSPLAVTSHMAHTPSLSSVSLQVGVGVFRFPRLYVCS